MVMATTRTAYEVGRDGAVAVFHRSGSAAWTHSNGEDCDVTGCRAIDAERAHATLYGSIPKRGRPRRTKADELTRAHKDRMRKKVRRQQAEIGLGRTSSRAVLSAENRFLILRDPLRVTSALPAQTSAG